MDALTDLRALGSLASPPNPLTGSLLTGSPALLRLDALSDSRATQELACGEQALMNQLLGILLLLMVGKANAATPQQQTGAPGAAEGAAATPAVGAAPPADAGGTGAAAPAAATGGTGGPAGAAPPAETADQGEIVSFIKQAASAYGADPNVLVEMARRESGFKTGAVNDWDSNAQKGTPSKGLFQFIEPTFKSMAPKAKAANPGAWAGMGEFNWMDWRQQALVAAWAIANGQGSHWTTYKASGGR